MPLCPWCGADVYDVGKHFLASPLCLKNANGHQARLDEPETPQVA